MRLFRQSDLIQSVADALQYISYYTPPDYLHALHAAWAMEQSTAAKDAMAQMLVNSRMCAEGRRPVCQDTGLVTCFLRIGMQVQWDGDRGVQELVDEGVRLAYNNPDNLLRKSMLSDPTGLRRNTGDNTPAMVHVELVPGDLIEVALAAKGGGSENKSRLAMLDPGDDPVAWIVETVEKLGAGWCPPGQLGIGIGGSAEKAVMLAKRAAMLPIDMHELRARGPSNPIEAMRLELYQRINALGIGAQGVGGLTTVLDVKILDYPTHAVSLPVALIPNCAATRHIDFTLDGSGPAELLPPSLDDWPRIALDTKAGRRLDLDRISREEIESLQPGETLLISGHLLTGRDAAHKRIQQLLARGAPLPDGLDFRNRFIYYVGPVDPVRDEVVGPAGPTTSSRMDRYSDMMLGELGLIGMVGKAERGPKAVDSIRRHRAVYLMAVGGAAYLVSKAIRSARMVAFEDLGMEAIREFEVQDMPVTVAVDSRGQSVHETGPRRWRIAVADPV